MAIQTFVADTILTAAQMNALQANDYNQTVSTKTASYTLVAADKGTKIVMNSASATTITVNTSLFSAGDTLTILNIAAGVCTVTAGTATVSTTGTLALVQNAGGTLYFTSAGVSVFQADGVTDTAGGLTFINGATFTTVASVSMAASTFTSTYTNYLVMLNITVSSVDQNISLRVNSAGVARTTSDYYGEKVSSTTAQASSGVSSVNFAAVRNTAPFVSYNIFVFNPASATSKTNLHGQGTGFPNGGAAGVVNIDFAALYDVAEANDGLTFLVGGTFTGSYKVYGLANS